MVSRLVSRRYQQCRSRNRTGERNSTGRARRLACSWRMAVPLCKTHWVSAKCRIRRAWLPGSVSDRVGISEFAAEEQNERSGVFVLCVLRSTFALCGQLGRRVDLRHDARRQDVFRARRGDRAYAPARRRGRAAAGRDVFRRLGTARRRRQARKGTGRAAVSRRGACHPHVERHPGLGVGRGECCRQGRQTRAEEPPLGEARLLSGRGARRAGRDPHGRRAA